MKRFLFALALLSGAGLGAYWPAYCPIGFNSSQAFHSDSPRYFEIQTDYDCGIPAADGCCYSMNVVISKWNGSAWVGVSNTTQEFHSSCGQGGKIGLQQYPIGSSGQYRIQVTYLDCSTGALKYGPKVWSHTFP